MITIIVFGLVELLVFSMFIQIHPQRGKFYFYTTSIPVSIIMSLVVVLLFGSLLGKPDITYTHMDNNKYRVHHKIRIFGENILTVNGGRDGDIAVKDGNTYYYQEDKNE